MGRREQRMPPCTYGAACKRKGCAYTHPKKHVVNVDVVCMPFLSDQCLFGKLCRNKHVGEEEKAALLVKFAAKPCRFGAHCKTHGCLYAHPREKQENADGGKTFGIAPSQQQPSAADLEARLAKQEAQRVQYEEMMLQHQQRLAGLALAPAPAPPPAQPRAPQPALSLSASATPWGAPVSAPPQQAQPGMLHHSLGSFDGAFSHRATEGYEHEASLALSAGYEGQGLYDHEQQGLYDHEQQGEFEYDQQGIYEYDQQRMYEFERESMFASGLGQDHQRVGSDPFAAAPIPPNTSNSSASIWGAPPASSQPMPTPAEALAAGPELLAKSNAGLLPQAPLSMAERLKRGAAEQHHQVGEPGLRLQSVAPRSAASSGNRGVARIPQELWVDATSRSSDAFTIKDPIQRFRFVNGKSPRGVLDLHFQTSQTVGTVLDRLLPDAEPYERQLDDSAAWVWVVTGSGHHTTQRLHRLFDVVQDYLDCSGYSYKLGKDSNGHFGAFLVKLKR